MLQHRSSLWHVKNFTHGFKLKNKASKFLYSESNPAYALASDRIKAVNRKKRDLSSKVGSEEPRVKIGSGPSKPKNLGNKNRDFLALNAKRRVESRWQKDC